MQGLSRVGWSGNGPKLVHKQATRISRLESLEWSQTIWHSDKEPGRAYIVEGKAWVNEVMWRWHEWEWGTGSGKLTFQNMWLEQEVKLLIMTLSTSAQWFSASPHDRCQPLCTAILSPALSCHFIFSASSVILEPKLQNHLPLWAHHSTSSSHCLPSPWIHPAQLRKTCKHNSSFS